MTSELPDELRRSSPFSWLPRLVRLSVAREDARNCSAGILRVYLCNGGSLPLLALEMLWHDYDMIAEFVRKDEGWNLILFISWNRAANLREGASMPAKKR